MGIEKSIKKLFSEPTEMRFGEVQSILYYYGYRNRRTTGSHNTFKREGFDAITIPSHHNKVKKIYLKYLKRTIIKYFNYFNF